jgi:hypothetical protein
MTGTLMSAIDSVANSALSRWRTVGHSATVLSWEEMSESVCSLTCVSGAIVEAVVVPSTRVIECVVAEETDWALVRSQVTEVINLGWMVTVLAPLNEMGAAHEGLRGSNARLQGWWQRAGHEMNFSRMELA